MSGHAWNPLLAKLSKTDPDDSPPIIERSDPVSVFPEPSIAVRRTVSLASSVPLNAKSTAYAPEFERLTELLFAQMSVFPDPSMTVA